MTVIDQSIRPIDYAGHTAIDPLGSRKSVSGTNAFTAIDPPDYQHPEDVDDYYAEVCEQPGCTHDRGSHWDATGDCGWCPCGQFRTAAVIDQDDPAQFATLANAYLPDDQPPF